MIDEKQERDKIASGLERIADEASRYGLVLDASSLRNDARFAREMTVPTKHLFYEIDSSWEEIDAKRRQAQSPEAQNALLDLSKAVKSLSEQARTLQDRVARDWTPGLEAFPESRLKIKPYPPPAAETMREIQKITNDLNARPPVETPLAIRRIPVGERMTAADLKKTRAKAAKATSLKGLGEKPKKAKPKVETAALKGTLGTKVLVKTISKNKAKVSGTYYNTFFTERDAESLMEARLGGKWKVEKLIHGSNEHDQPMRMYLVRDKPPKR